MCGLAGFWQPGGVAREAAGERLATMTDALRHRGPDDSGHWIDPDRGVALGFRRLSILDLSPLGAQPMVSESGRYVLTFNGEVYNFLELAEELARCGARFKGRSDTEVILASIERWGFRDAFERFVGMFAMAVWDAQEKCLTLVRDRLGIKPLYYTSSSGTLLFGSELKALRRDPAFDPTLDRAAVLQYLTYLFVPAPSSIYARVRKLPPGHFLQIEDPRAPLPEPVSYWSLSAAATAGLTSPLGASDEEAADQLEQLLSDAVRIRLRSDVPLGVLLSGGVDSSLVAALAQSHLVRPIQTFSIGFDAAEHDESAHAEAVANALSTDHTAIRLSNEEVLAAVPRVARIYDEPLADPSQIPTLLVSELARTKVTVGLTGDGGDELFAGYNRYALGGTWIPRLQRLPPAVRAPFGALIGSPGTRGWDAAFSLVGRARPGGTGLRLPGEKMLKLSRLLEKKSSWDMYASLLGAGVADPLRLMRAPVDVRDAIASRFEAAPVDELVERMLFVDQGTYLPDDLLAKVDRASMAVSLELRVPILDHRVVELAWRIPMSQKVRHGEGKWLLKKVLYRHVSRDLVERPKVGFTPPVADWLRRGLREWADDLLSPDRLKATAILDPTAVRAEWSAFLSGRSELALGLWAIVQLQAWAEEYA